MINSICRLDVMEQRLKSILMVVLAVSVSACAGLSRQLISGSNDEGECETITFKAGRLNVSQRWVSTQEKCIVVVSDDAVQARGRSYIFTSFGMLLTFSSFGSGSVSQTTGARTHYLLPNVQPLRVEHKGRSVLVHTTSGHIVTFDTNTGHPKGISGGVFQVARSVKLASGSGVTLRLRSGIVVDFGFMLGESPHNEPNRKATLIDGRGRRCTVQNKDVLSYDQQEPALRFSSMEELSEFLKSERGLEANCVALNVVAN